MGCVPYSGLADIKFWAATVFMLPHLEQGALYNTFNFSFTSNSTRGNGQINGTACTTKLNVYLCPSDIDRLTNVHGHINYAGNAGSDGRSFEVASPFNGPFAGIKRAIGFAALSDGLSNTVAFSERVKGIGLTNNAQLDPMRPSATFSEANTNVGDPPTTYQRCQAAPPAQGATMTVGDPSGYLYFDASPACSRYNHAMPPNTWSCANLRSFLNGAASTASSRHPGAVNCAMSDGSVKAIKSTIAKEVWWALGTMSNGEVISSDAY